MQSEAHRGVELARRLRALRETHWPGTRVTQQQLAEAFGGERPLSESLISAWESVRHPTPPPVARLEAYATFFATSRSIEGRRARLLRDDELTDEERTAREELLAELLRLRSAAGPVAPTEAVRIPVGATGDAIGGGTWYFADRRPVTIICARLPPKMRERMPYTDPQDPDYVRSYTFADLDALIELHGHVRAVNPGSLVHIRTPDTVEADDLTTHLVLLGGVDWNPVTQDIAARVGLPVRQHGRPDEDPYGGFFEAGNGAAAGRFAPVLDTGGHRPVLREDVAHFYRGTNPYNVKRTVTVCNGMYGRGTYGAVRALTDARFRDRNEEYLARRFAGRSSFSLLARVLISVTGETLTPDWNIPENRLHEWPEREEPEREKPERRKPPLGSRAHKPEPGE